MKQVDYIIVGQGLAGTVLAQTLLLKGQTIVIVDDENLSQASRVAAGLYNPVVFKRLVKSWMADQLIPYLDQFYSDSEILLNSRFYYKKQIVKLFSEEAEKGFWLKKANEEVGKYLSKEILTDFLNDIVYNPLGASEVLNAGNLDTLKFLTAFRSYFKHINLLIEEKFEYSKLDISKDKVKYDNYEAKKVIFCEGFKATENPFFKWLPFKLTKGEIITIKVKSDKIIPEEKVINKGVFILPLGENKYKVGATYEWNDLSENTTAKGKSELTEKLEKVLKLPFEITDHQAGIRPTVNDRRPMLGVHPEYPALAVFNGLGTKGVMLAPYFANLLAMFLTEGIPLNKEIDINRF